MWNPYIGSGFRRAGTHAIQVLLILVHDKDNVTGTTTRNVSTFPSFTYLGIVIVLIMGYGLAGCTQN
jgi:p-aminobenzoyl-glutamate transporter AbgT